MPATTPREDAAIRAAVIRLSRPDGDGGAVIERAAILAEGTPSAAIEAWIIDHGGQPEAVTTGSPASGSYGLRGDATPVDGRRAPRRYLLPATALSPSS